MYLNQLSSRFNAPSRSPLRRVGCTRASTPFKRKSPTNNGSETPLFEAEDLDTISLRAQAELCHEILHLSPALQRFWNVSKINSEGNLFSLQNVPVNSGLGHFPLDHNVSVSLYHNRKALMRLFWQSFARCEVKLQTLWKNPRIDWNLPPEPFRNDPLQRGIVRIVFDTSL